MAPSQPRCEPVLGWPAAAASADARLPTQEATGERAKADSPGAPALPWIALAVAAVILATPVLASRGPGAGEAFPAATIGSRDLVAAVREPRLADEDEVAFGRFTLRLAGASSADELWHRWADMKQRRLGLLDDLTAAVRPAGSGPAAGYQLLVGDFRNAATAAEACGTLRARYLACEVVNRDGTNLRPQG